MKKRLLKSIAAIALMTLGHTAQAGIKYVKANATGTNDGTSWANAYRNLDTAIINSASGDSLFVAAGTYKPAIPVDNYTLANAAGNANNRVNAFVPKNGMKIYGGFAGTNDTTLAQRNIAANVTTLSGDIGAAGNNGDNCYHVVVMSNVTATVDGFTISGGNANGSGGNSSGGGIATYSGVPTLANNTITNNSSTNLGGGAYVSSFNPIITNNIFSSNTANLNGGGLYTNNGSPFISGNTFCGNTANGAGGGIFTFQGTPLLVNNVITGNSGNNGGGVRTQYSNGILCNNTISGNFAITTGGGILVYSGTISFKNCIIWNNNTGVGYNGGTIYYTNCNIQDFLAPGNGNISRNPLFVNPLSPGLNTGGNYKLQQCSWSIDRGDNANLPSGIANDKDGAPRIQHNTVDMGAYETDSLAGSMTPIVTSPTYLYLNNTYAPLSAIGVSGSIFKWYDHNQSYIGTNAPTPSTTTIHKDTFYVTQTQPYGCESSKASIVVIVRKSRIYVDSSKTSGANNGTSWTDAYTDLQNAINDSYSGDTIFVAKGTYRPNRRIDAIDSITPNDRNNAFLIKDNIKIYGGFTGVETSLTQRPTSPSGIPIESSILSGDIGIIGNDNDNCLHVVVMVKVRSTLDGFTILEGMSTGAPPTNPINGENINNIYGGGVYIAKGSPQLTNNIIKSNLAAYKGGGLFIDADSPLIANNVIKGNKSNAFGGGLYIINGTSILNNNIIDSNTSLSYGAGLYLNGSHELNNNTISRNATQAPGGGVYNTNGNITLINNKINNNISSAIGGGIYNEGGSPVFKNNAMRGNSASYGGALYLTNSSPTLINNLLTGNIATSGPGGAIFFGSCNTLLYGNTLSGNFANGPGGGIFFNGATSIITNTIIWGNSSGFYNGGASITFNNCNIQDGLQPGTGNISVDPLFMSPLSPGLSTGGDYRLRNCSPSINTGDNTKVPSGTTTDISGNSRIQYATVDMGAYEHAKDGSDSTADIVMANAQKQLTQATGATYYTTTSCDSLLVKLKPTGASPVSGTVTAKVWIDAAQNAQILRRHYEVTPANNAGTATGTLTLYFTQAEFDSFNVSDAVKLPLNATDATGKANLLIEKRGGTSSDGSGAPSSYSGATTIIDPADTSIVWNANFSRWEVTFDVNGFSGFFVKTQSTPLPNTFGNIAAVKDGNRNRIEWNVYEEENGTVHTVERSTDGIRFSAIGSANGKGNNSAYVFYDNNPPSPVSYYRISSTGAAGRAQYSKVVWVNRNTVGNISVHPVPATDKVTVSGIDNALMGKQMRLEDLSGKQVAVYTISGNTMTVNLSTVAPGLYILSLPDGSRAKIVKQ